MATGSQDKSLKYSEFQSPPNFLEFFLEQFRIYNKVVCGTEISPMLCTLPPMLIALPLIYIFHENGTFFTKGKATVFLAYIMQTHIFCALHLGLLYARYVIIIPMYNVHPYFSLKTLGKKVPIIHRKIQCMDTSYHPKSIVYKVFILTVAHPIEMGLEKCVTYIHHYNIVQSISVAIKILCTLLISLSYPQSPATTDLSTVSMVFPFPDVI